jgi:hypothetical protein
VKDVKKELVVLRRYRRVHPHGSTFRPNKLSRKHRGFPEYTNTSLPNTQCRTLVPSSNGNTRRRRVPLPGEHRYDRDHISTEDKQRLGVSIRIDLEGGPRKAGHRIDSFGGRSAVGDGIGDKRPIERRKMNEELGSSAFSFMAKPLSIRTPKAAASFLAAPGQGM